MYDYVIADEQTITPLDPTDWVDSLKQTKGNGEPPEQTRRKKFLNYPPQALSGVLGIPLTEVKYCPEGHLYVTNPNGRIPELLGDEKVIVKIMDANKVVKHRGKTVYFSLEELLNVPEIEELLCDEHQ